MRKSKISQDILVAILITALIASGYFVYQWWQARKELKDAATQIEKLLNQINIQINKIKKLEKEIKELKRTDETANWKTYRNEEFGYEIKYPKEWKVIENPYPGCEITGCDVIRGSVSSLTIHREKRKGMSLQEFYRWTSRNFRGNRRFNITIDGHPAIKEEFDYSQYNIIPPNDTRSVWGPVNYYILKDEYIYTLEGGITQSADEQKYRRIFDQILSTFKFINHQ